MTNGTYTILATGTHEDDDGVRLKFYEGDVIAMETAHRFGLPGSTNFDELHAEATADGTVAGQISASGALVSITSDDANKIITLPPPVPGVTIAMRNGATGYELRTSDPDTISINGGSGAAAESAIPANTFTICVCDTTTSWICSNTDTAGEVTVTEVAAP